MLRFSSLKEEPEKLIESVAMENLIQILNENPEKNHVISVDMWLKHSYQWFMPGGPYSSSSAGEREDWFDYCEIFLGLQIVACDAKLKNTLLFSVNGDYSGTSQK